MALLDTLLGGLTSGSNPFDPSGAQPPALGLGSGAFGGMSPMPSPTPMGFNDSTGGPVGGALGSLGSGFGGVAPPALGSMGGGMLGGLLGGMPAPVQNPFGGGFGPAGYETPYDVPYPTQVPNSSVNSTTTQNMTGQSGTSVPFGQAMGQLGLLGGGMSQPQTLPRTLPTNDLNPFKTATQARPPVLPVNPQVQPNPQVMPAQVQPRQPVMPAPVQQRQQMRPDMQARQQQMQSRQAPRERPVPISGGLAALRNRMMG